MPYLYDAHRGGSVISDAIGRRTEERLRRFARQRFDGRFRDLGVWFRGPFCYLDLYPEPDPVPEGWSAESSHETREQYRDRLAATAVPLCRLRYFGNPDRWSFATYHEVTRSYQPATFPSGDAAGPPEVALELVLSQRLD